VADDEPWGRHYKGFTLVRCRRCGLRYVNPRPRAEDVLDVYGDRYFDKWRAREADPDAEARAGADDRRYADVVLAHARAEKPSVLDVGTGRGSFLIHLGATGRAGRLAGTDVTDVNAEHLRGHRIELHVGELDDLAPGAWDAVTAHHVLEHVLDPNAFLESCRRLLAPGGILHVVVPNEGSAISRWKSFQSRARLKSRPFKHLSPEHHLWFFEPATVTRLLEKNGFRVVYLSTMAGGKRRNAFRRLAQGALDRLRLNAWLQVVAAPTPPAAPGAHPASAS
jgi:2-polyprenyl-3-methyl-5-hydroxy-6-metoxy-1,4-benzoquinol methylase